MAGTKYNSKQALIDAWKSLIFPNKKKKITGAKHQTAGLDLIESLWRDSSECFTETFSVVDNGATLNVSREVCGSTVKIVGKITNNDVPAAKKLLITDLIPMNFQGKRWFRLKHVSMTLNKTNDLTLTNGYLELDEVSTWGPTENPTPDKTLLHIPGRYIGTNRAYNIDDINVLLHPVTGLVDRVETNADSDNYIQNSAKDLAGTGFHLAFLTHEQAMIDYGLAPNGSSEGVDISFVIEGDLF